MTNTYLGTDPHCSRTGNGAPHNGCTPGVARYNADPERDGMAALKIVLQIVFLLDALALIGLVLLQMSE
ncbi:MAG: preprotein translocase subunit SecG, partial [Candidatus Bipolaricaulis sp.]|nr:preprotein translocase subunit SecG [Candidatus Bipolaricaulis sp.]